MKKEKVFPHEDSFLRKIYNFGGSDFILGIDLAWLFDNGCATCKREVQRNIDRFPVDCMFKLTPEEIEEWQLATGASDEKKMYLTENPYAFTEHGILMLVSLFSEKWKIDIIFGIVRVLVNLRKTNQVGYEKLLEKAVQTKEELRNYEDALFQIMKYMKKEDQESLEKISLKNWALKGKNRNVQN